MMNEFFVEDAKRMKSNIERILDGALHDPLFTVSMVEYIKANCVVSGGISVSAFYNEQPNDVDLYFKSQLALDHFLKRYKDDKSFLAIVKDVNPSYTGVIVNGKLITTNAITLHNNVQLITCVLFDEIEKFDFVHCKPHYDLLSKQYFISNKQYTSIKNKQLMVNYASAVTDKRTQKFLKRGWLQ
jgi:hypothetical protein